jgi:DNA-binding MarR family transcriptional regulator
VESTDGSTLLALQRATHATLDAIAEQLGDASLGPTEANVLATLADKTPRTPSTLAAAIGRRTTTMTSVLDRLEARGLIARARHPDDRRAIRIELTASGRKAAHAAREALRRVEERALAGLPAAKVAALRAALDWIAELRGARY